MKIVKKMEMVGRLYRTKNNKKIKKYKNTKKYINNFIVIFFIFFFN